MPPLSNPGKNRPPYRPPCGGWLPAQYFYPQHDNYRAADAKIPAWVNATCILQYLCNPVTCAPPVPLPDCGNLANQVPPQTNGCNTPCSNGGSYPPAPCQPGQIQIGDNCFAPSVPAAFVNRALCYKFGFKNVLAFKSWQGAPGFLDDCPADGGCVYRPFTPNAPQTRYLAVAINVTWADNDIFVEAVTEDDCHGNPIPVNLTNGNSTVSSFAQNISVDRYSGNTTVTGTAQMTGTRAQYFTTDPAFCSYQCEGETTTNCQLTAAGWCNEGTPAFLTDVTCQTSATANAQVMALVNFGGCAPPNFSGHVGGTGDPSPAGYNPAWGPGNFTVAVTETTYTLSFTADNPDQGIVISVSFTLSNPYTASQLQQDTRNLLSWWDLTNDAVYPWRTDTSVTSAPLVTFDENQNQNPLSSIGLANGLYGTNTGAILGKPTPAGYSPYWDYKHPAYTFGVCNTYSVGWTIGTWGATAPAWCPQATQWTDNFTSTGLYGGAYAGIGGAGGHQFPFMVNPGCDQPSYSLFTYGCAMQKWAETILFVKPSHNFARPCGPDDAAAIDQTTINCASNPSGNPRWPDLAACPVPPASGYQWNDTGMKGDYCTRELTYNARDVGEYARLLAIVNSWDMSCGSPPSLPPNPRAGSALLNIEVDQRCAKYSNCCPAVVCFSPNGELWQNGITLPIPEISLDWDYGSFWYGEVDQWMVDPLFQVPVTCDPNTRWSTDNGSCQPPTTTNGITTNYYWPPYEECRATVPAGAPALPDGILLGATNTAPGVWTGPLSGEPLVGGGAAPDPMVILGQPTRPPLPPK